MATDVRLSERVASEIRAWMGREQITGRELARRLDTTHTWVSTRIRGEVPIDLNDLERFADALGVTVADLLPSAVRSARPKTPKIHEDNRVLEPMRRRRRGQPNGPADNRPNGGAQNTRRPSLLRRPPSRSDLVTAR